MQTQIKAKKDSAFRRFLGRLDAFQQRRPVTFTALLALVLALVLEMLGRHSVVKGVVFVFSHPVNFLTNVSIVLLTLSVSYLFKRRRFILGLFSGIWLLLGLANAIVLCFRSTPLGAVDIAILPSAISIIDVYIDVWLIVLLALVLLAGLVWLVWAFFKSEKRTPNYRHAAAFVLACACLAAGLYGVTMWVGGQERQQVYSNIVDAYDRYGFVYCFGTGALDRGIDEPDFYSPQAVEQLIDRMEPGSPPAVKPDIVMVQLESFFDVSYLDDVSYEDDPIPVFRSLKENYASGFLTVPSVGAGTANTEFEVLSGMSLDFFGMGEYPYMTILQEEACETIATDLKAMGYRAHAVHNNTGTFYVRNKVFAQLGFDTYTSLEFMNGVEYNPIGWAKDEILTGEIEKALDSSDDPHFVFAITVQGHGKYQRGVDSEDTEHLNITWAGDEDEQDALGYYLSQLRETDAFIGQLVQMLQQRGKPAVLVLYGDHLPNFDIGSDQLKNGNIFQTEYVIWNNMGLEMEDRDLEAYQLSAHVLEALGAGGGVITRYHQQMGGREDYEDGLQLLEYDMLYGDFYCYGGANPYTASDLRMGLDPIVVDGADIRQGDGESLTLTVTGENFTDWSRIAVDEEELDTVLDPDGSLSAQLDEPPEAGARITVHQRAANKSGVLAESNPYTWK